MYIYITVGTYPFLKAIKERFPQEKMSIMGNEEDALLLHETNGDTVFKVPRKYEILDESGEIGANGFVVLSNIPVTDEGRPIFEYRFINRPKQIENEQGFLAIRGLRPLSSNTYVILTVWENETAFNNWKNTPSFKEAHQGSINKGENGREAHPIFSSASYMTKYAISEETVKKG